MVVPSFPSSSPGRPRNRPGLLRSQHGRRAGNRPRTCPALAGTRGGGARAGRPPARRRPVRGTPSPAGALTALGASVEDSPAGWRVTPGTATGDARVDVGNAGTVMRFVPPVAALTTAAAEFHGDARAAQRPIGPIIDGLREIGAVIDDGGRSAIPFTVHGTGSLAGGVVTVDASASSQMVSGLLLAAPRYDKGVEVRHRGPRAPSAPHIAMTVQMLRDAGAEVETETQRAGGRPRAG